MDDSGNRSGDGGAAVVVILIRIVVVIGIFLIIYWCFKRAVGGAIPAPKCDHLQYPEFPVISDSEVEGATMKRFLSNIARERALTFSPHQLAGFTKNFSQVLGSGGFGVVYKGEFPTGLQIAVKVLNNTSVKRVAEQFMAEVGTIGRTHHINLVRLYGLCFHNTMKALVYEYLEFGSLDKLLFTELNQSVDWEKLHDIAIGTAKGIAYLHEECQQRIIHYDIKPGNVLLDVNLKPKVADFGLAKLCNQDSTHVELSGYRGTPGYAAPEMYRPFTVTQACDVYSFGMLLFEIVGRRRNHDPKLSDNSQEWLPKWTYDKYKKDELSEMLTICSIQEKDREKAKRMVMVALWCVQYLPKARPMMSSVVKMLEGGVEISTPPNPFGYLEDLDLELKTHDYPNGSTSMESSDQSLPPLVAWNHSMDPPTCIVWESLQDIEMGANTL